MLGEKLSLKTLLSVVLVWSLAQGASAGLSKTHEVTKGDTLWDISESFYGSGIYWEHIFKANSIGKLPNGNPLIFVGDLLLIPDLGIGFESSRESTISYENKRYGYTFELPESFLHINEDEMRMDFDPYSDKYVFGGPNDWGPLEMVAKSIDAPELFSEKFEEYPLTHPVSYSGGLVYENSYLSCHKVFVSRFSTTVLELNLCSLDDKLKSTFLSSIKFEKVFGGQLSHGRDGLTTYSNSHHKVSFSFTDVNKEYVAVSEHRNAIHILDDSEGGGTLILNYSSPYVAFRGEHWTEKYDTFEDFLGSARTYAGYYPDGDLEIDKFENSSGTTVYKDRIHKETVHYFPHPTDKEIIYKLTGSNDLVEQAAKSFRILNP